jgi:hypothetical protein
MAVSAITASQTSLINSLTTTSVATTVTSSDPTALARLAQQLASQLTQLQNQGGNAQEIEKIRQAMQAVKSKIQQQERLAEEKAAEAQSPKPFTRGIDTKA